MTSGKIDKYSFNLIADPKVLLPILKSRLPRSCPVSHQNDTKLLFDIYTTSLKRIFFQKLYNETLSNESFKNVKQFYTLEPEVKSNSWIILVWNREVTGGLSIL